MKRLCTAHDSRQGLQSSAYNVVVGILRGGPANILYILPLIAQLSSIQVWFPCPMGLCTSYLSGEAVAACLHMCTQHQRLVALGLEPAKGEANLQAQSPSCACVYAPPALACATIRALGVMGMQCNAVQAYQF